MGMVDVILAMEENDIITLSLDEVLINTEESDDTYT